MCHAFCCSQSWHTDVIAHPCAAQRAEYMHNLFYYCIFVAVWISLGLIGSGRSIEYCSGPDPSTTVNRECV